MAYCKMKWHSDAPSYPKDLPAENAGTHIGMFFAWCATNKLLSEELIEDCTEPLGRLINRSITGRDFLVEQCDSALTHYELSGEGNAFAEYYYDSNKYMKDYGSTFNNVATLYHVEDTWTNYDKLKSVMDKQYTAWKKQ